MKPDSDIDRSLVTARVVTKHYETQPLSYKKLSSGRETARCFRVIEYLTKSLKVIGNDALEKGVNPH